MATDGTLKETGTSVANLASPVKSTSSPNSSSTNQAAQPPSTVSVTTATGQGISRKVQEASTSKSAMSNGYYDGSLPDQSAGVSTQPNNGNGEYATNATTAQPTTTDPSIGGGSVVNDLMKVYEDMTKSSTPQVPPAASQKYHIPPPMFSVPPNANQPLHSLFVVCLLHIRRCGFKKSV